MFNIFLKYIKYNKQLHRLAPATTKKGKIIKGTEECYLLGAGSEVAQHTDMVLFFIVEIDFYD